MHIAIAGNIGSGKTTLTKLLSKNMVGNLISNLLIIIPIWLIITRIWKDGLSICRSIS